MNTEQESVFSHVIQIILAGAFGAWAWVVKHAAGKHLETVDRVEKKLDDLASRVNDLEAWRRYSKFSGLSHEREE